VYCPRCATQNIDDARYCRSCGANLSLVPQALTGSLGVNANPSRSQLARGIAKATAGLVILIILFGTFLSRGSGSGALWLLIPIFLLLGRGAGDIVAATVAKQTSARRQARRQAGNTRTLPESTPFISQSPPSVTERTTRQLDPHSKGPKQTY